jgi:molybdenum cofactor cytidylyltransferase
MTAAVILAAGAACRFDGEKLAAVMTIDGRAAPLIVHAVRPWLTVFDQVTVVLRPQGDGLRALLLAEYAPERLNFVVCEQAEGGMGASLGCGVQANADASGWIIGLADMPRVPVTAIAAVNAAVAAGAALAAPYFNARRGHPVGFAHRYFDELTNLSGDEGGRHILQRDQMQTQHIEIADRGILLDIDTPEDLRRLD